MTDSALQTYLPAFIMVFLLVTFFWGWFRKITKLYNLANVEKSANYDRLKRIAYIFKIIFIIFTIMTIIYAFIPDFYFVFIPFEVFNQPIINTIGVLILKVALAWMVVAQILIDKELYKYSRNMGDLSAMELVHYSERMFLGGLVVMFIGMFVTITNLIGIVIGTLALLSYLNVFKRERSDTFKNFFSCY